MHAVGYVGSVTDTAVGFPDGNLAAKRSGQGSIDGSRQIYIGFTTYDWPVNHCSE